MARIRVVDHMQAYQRKMVQAFKKRVKPRIFYEMRFSLKGS